jgi:hypothetical protein
MTAAPTPRGAAPSWYARPKIVLPIIGVLLVLMAVNVPQENIGRSGDPRLTTYSTGPMGAKMFYEMAHRFGWQVEQRKAPDLPDDTSAIIAVLDPVVPLRGPEVHALLEHARNGGALLTMLGDGSALLADSLRLAIGSGRQRVKHRDGETQGCAPDKPGLLNERFLYTIWPGDLVMLTTIGTRGPLPDSTTRFVEMDTLAPGDHGRPRHAAIGFPYGRGRIVVGADPDLLRNDALRVCKYGLDVAAIQMLEYLDEPGGSRRPIVFDEYHQGYGEQRGTMTAVATYLVGASSGRWLVQMLAAGLILLLAVAPRLIPPQDPARIERRSPLEHVDALGRAYAQVGATQSATVRLIRGVRRRVAGGAVRPATDASDDAFLDRAQRDAPQLAESVALIRKSLHARVSRSEFAAVGAALDKLEISLTRI